MLLQAIENNTDLNAIMAKKALEDDFETLRVGDHVTATENNGAQFRGVIVDKILRGAIPAPDHYIVALSFTKRTYLRSQLTKIEG